MFKFLKPRKKSGIEKWAEEEIRLACNINGEYARACYNSAIRAYKSLLKDGHSGASIYLTHEILNRLIDMKPLTAIEDVPEVWNDISMRKSDEGTVEQYQCKRMSSLFKDVYDDGTVKFTDVDRVSCIDIANPTISWHCRLGDNIVDELFPIEMPYYPTKDPYKLYKEDFLVDHENGDYDTQGFFYLITPYGDKIEVNKFYKEQDGEWVEIEVEEYNDRKTKNKYLITPYGDKIEVNKFYKEQDGEWVEIGIEEYNDRKIKNESRRLNDVNF